MRRFPAQAFSGPMVHVVDGKCDLFRGHVQQVGVRGEVLADYAIGVLIQAALPRMVRMGNEDSRIQAGGDSVMPGEFFSIVKSNRVATVAVWLKQEL